MVFLKSGPSAGKIAVISEIIDHNRVRILLATGFFPSTNLFIDQQALIDGPSTGVPRQPFPYKHLVLTPLKLSKLPRGSGTGVIKKQLEKEAIVEKWEKSAWTQRRLAFEKRRALNDFGRFQVLLAKKQRRDIVRKKLHKSKA